jgi:alpha-amylase/alpha-mannosidase (GH57 family)
MERYICIHGHFYQPPRENPWLEAVEIQDSASPYHDWNERVTAECYAPNCASRLLDREGKIVDIVGNYAGMNFDFGPTLLAWLEARSPEVYQAIINADKESALRHSGHGNAIAQAYNHIILPLASLRDKRTQIEWGLKDFEYRFGRVSEGMWLPETAVDIETLEILSEKGIKFTILAPHQARSVKRIGIEDWEDTGTRKIDPTRPYLCRLPSGRTISIFFYDELISRTAAFENLLDRGEDFVNRLLAGFPNSTESSQLLSIATDGETYGHHHRFADMALAFAIDEISKKGLVHLTNYGEYLAKHPADWEVRIVENTSWSCPHGVERWKSDCGCNAGGRPDWNQEWRGPLRGTFDWLRDELTPGFEEMAGRYLKDPWRARESYIDIVLNRSEENMEVFFRQHPVRELGRDEKIVVLKLMEMQRHLMLMYTSCGWFFDEPSGIETVQVLQYAARAIQLAEELFGRPLEESFRGHLSRIKSNLPDHGDGTGIYDRFVKTSMVDFERVGADYAITSVVEDYGDLAEIYCYTVTRDEFQRLQAGEARLVTGRITVTSKITLNSETVSFSFLHLGGHLFNGGAQSFLDAEAYRSMQTEIMSAFEKGALADVLKLIEHHFGNHGYSLLNLFGDEQRKLLDRLTDASLEGFEHTYRLIYENNRLLMLFLREAGVPVPKAFLAAAEFTLNHEIRHALDEEETDIDRVKNSVHDIANWYLTLDPVDVEFTLRRKLEALMDALRDMPSDIALLSRLQRLLTLQKAMPLELNLWHVQNNYFRLAEITYPEFLRKAEAGDEDAARWIDQFKQLGETLYFNNEAILPKS